jgi:GNAT superfamily N-acetyltransferase
MVERVAAAEGCLVFSGVQTLKPVDIPSAVALSTLANWNQTEDDWHRLLQLYPNGSRFIEESGEVIATASLLPFGAELAWIGMVLTHPEYRKQGLARRLMQDAIANAERLGIRTLKLDATDQGRPLYESLGFIVENTVERWGREDNRPDTQATLAHIEDTVSTMCLEADRISEELIALDQDAFGASRKDILAALIGSGDCTVHANGYVLSRPGRVARYLGPCVAGSEKAARDLIACHLHGHMPVEEKSANQEQSRWYWDLLPSNAAAVHCAEDFGFTRRRVLWRMRLGNELGNNDAMVYAIAGFECG